MGTRAPVTDPVSRLSPTWRMAGGVQGGCPSPEDLGHGAACDLPVKQGGERREGARLGAKKLLRKGWGLVPWMGPLGVLGHRRSRCCKEKPEGSFRATGWKGFSLRLFQPLLRNAPPGA